MRSSALTGEETTWNRTVVIMGGGGIGRELASKLGAIPGVSVKVVERDVRRAQALDALGTNCLVLHGDATDLDLLQEERIGEANVYVATTNDDEDNMVACQIAKALGVERTVAMVNKASYRQVYDLMGVDQAISPRILCAKRILRFVRAGSPRAIAVVGEGRAEVLDMIVKLKEPIKIKALGLPKGAVIGARVRGERVVVPTGEDVLEDEDRVIVFTLPSALLEVEKLFAKS